ncbi:2OG-Fe(II) oxygenase [Nitrosopumilus sp.]|uniref:2OG-Fe(II)-dependent halogenase WelO5 family protein n=1 Tax=Nitrosopumilus sp. TaxID=2024843 RepID=UPI00292E1AE7|nr:2OG-Fe(II) oxygenase [Nitrosopumilus sp.]
MWESAAVNTSQANEVNLEHVLSGKIPATVIHNFYDEKYCQTIANRVENHSQDNFQNGKLRHIGPFLMSYVTSKKKYFEDAKQSQRTFERIFCGIKNPIIHIYNSIGKMFPDYSISLAHEFKKDYSSAIIRIHEKGKSIPVHKDNVKYEGKEYALSNIDHQLSCVLHLQESESGGNLVMYNKQWKKEDERFRNIDFGYSSRLTESSESCKISKFKAGDLVIMNPRYYHKVTKIAGNTPRITLGMFLGFHRKERKIVAWA